MIEVNTSLFEEGKKFIESNCFKSLDSLIREDVQDFLYFDERADKVVTTNFIVETGASKLVLISKNKNVSEVLKIPFEGSNDIYEEDNEENAHFFQGANADEKWNYCATEANYYQEAKELGIESFFAKTKRVGTMEYQEGFIPVYSQEKIIIKANNTPSKKSHWTPNFTRLISKINKKWNECELPDEWIESAIRCTNIFKVNSFINFICVTHPEINADMHCQNYGYRSDGTPCLCDFSGYLE